MDYDIDYVILQEKYRKLHPNNDNIFPKNWYNVKEYELKKRILKDCLNRNCLIIESKEYQNFNMIAIK